MNNRIAGMIYNWEQLMNLPEAPVVPPHIAVTQVNPIRMMIPKEWLEQLVLANLESIAANREQIDTTPERAAYTDALIAQRQHFLEQIAASADDELFMAFYCADVMEEGTDDDLSRV